MDEGTCLKEQELSELKAVPNETNSNPTQPKEMDETTVEQEPDYNRDKTLFYLDKVQRKETRDLIKKIDTNNSGKVMESEVVQYIKNETEMTKKAKFFKKTAFWLLLTVFALIISVIVLVVYVLNAKQDILSKNDAVILLGNVMNEVISTYNPTNITNASSSNFSLTSDEVSNVRRVFNSFDVDSDGSLDFEEFSDYWLYLKPNKNAFGGMDINGDKILSYREIVAYLNAIYNIPIAGPIFTNMLSVSVKDMYNYTYNPNNTKPVFFEYAADVYFEFFDPDYKGYISHIDYVMVMSGATFSNEDIDKNEKLSFEEFMGGTFYEEGISFVSNTMSTINFNSFGSEFNASKDISLNESDVIGVELHKCPNIYNQMSSNAAQSVQRRRALALAPLAALKWAFSTCVTVKPPGIKTICKAAWDAVSCIYSAASTILDCACRECDTCTKCTCTGCGCNDCHCRVPTPVYTWDCNDDIETNKGLCVDSTLDTLGNCLSCLKHKIDSNDAKAECCFAEHGIVYLKDGSTKELRNVLIGEYVFDGDGYTKVIAVERRGEFKLNMITLYVYNSDKSVEKSITLTGDHLLYDKNNKLIAAAEVRIGDVIFDDYMIYNILKSEEWPSTPITISGNIYVNGVKASCYIGNEKTAAILHNLLAIHRWISENISEWLTAKMVESCISEIMWMKRNIVEPYDLYWMFEGGSVTMVFIFIFGAIGIRLKQILFFFVSFCVNVSYQKIIFCGLCGVVSFNYRNKR